MYRLPPRPVNRSRTRGAVLLLAMIFLLLLAMIAGTVMQTSTMEFRMAGNEQFREEAFQKAQAVASSLSEDTANFPVAGAVGYTVCKNGDTDPDCDVSILTADPVVAAVPTGVDVDYRVERQGPLVLENLPFRQSQQNVSSTLSFHAAMFEARVVVDGNSARLGRAEVAQGVARLIAGSASGQ